MAAVQPPQLRPPLLRPPSSSSTLHPSTSLPIPSSSRSGLPPPARTSSLQSSTPAPRRVPAQAGSMMGAQPPSTAGGTVRKVSGGAKATETPAEGQRTPRRPGRVLQAVAEREGGETTGYSTLKRSTSGLPPPTSSTIRTLSSSTSLRTFPSSTTSKRAIPSSSSLAVPETASPQTPRTRARSRSIASQALQRSLSRSASGRRLSSRRQEAEGEQEDGETTVKPARRVLPPSSARVEKGKNPETASPRKKPALSGLGRPAPPSTDGDTSLITLRKSSSTLRSISASSSLSASTQQKTPLRTSTRRPSRGGAATAESEMKPPPPPSASIASSSRTLPRRVPASAVPASSIPVAGRVLKKPPPPAPSSVASDASTVTAGSSVASATAEAAMRRSRADGRMVGPPGFQAGKPRSSGAARGASKIPPRPRSSYVSQDGTRQQQQVEGGRRDSWVTESEPGSARPSLSGTFEPLPDNWDGQHNSALPFPSASSTSAAFDPESFATPRKPSSSSYAAADPSLFISPPPTDGASTGLPPTRASLSYISPDAASSLSRTIYLSPSSAAASPPVSALLSASSSSLLSPSTPSAGLLTPGPRPRQVSLLRTGRRNKPRESASLEEILRLGLQTHAAGGDGGGAKELELLLDEGSSALMREDLEGVETGGVGGGTPWRGRVLSLSVSSAGAGGASPRGGRRGSVLIHSPPEEEQVVTEEEGGQGDEQDHNDDEQQERQLLILPLRPSTHEAASLRREIASLQAELSSLRRQSSLAHPPPSPLSPGGAQKEEEDDRVSALEEELQEQRERMERMEEEHRAEVEAMEADLAALAVGASLAQPVPPPAPAPQPSSSFAHALTLAKLQLDLSSALSASASLSASAAYEAVEARARRERDEVRGEVESLRCVMGGLKGWEGVLQGVCG